MKPQPLKKENFLKARVLFVHDGVKSVYFLIDMTYSTKMIFTHALNLFIVVFLPYKIEFSPCGGFHVTTLASRLLIIKNSRYRLLKTYVLNG